MDQTDGDVCSLECKARHLNCTSAKKDEELLDSTAESGGALRMKAFSNKLQLQYNENPVIAKLSVSKVDDIREALNIRVRGNNVSKPILEFKHCQLTETLGSNLVRCGYATPTPVQMQVIPVSLCSRDLLVCAHTGSGKTAAFLVPIIQRIYAEVEFLFNAKRLSNNPFGVIMSPTRELCTQIEKQAKELMQGLPNMKTALLVGGMPIPPQLHRLSSGVQIIVATPGRMREIVNTESSVDLSSVKVFVLDEVDIMLQMGFEQQVQEVIDKLPAEKQTLMFSATVSTSIEIVADKLLVNPVYVSIGSPSEPNASVKQIVLWVEEQLKKKHLFSLLQDPKHFMPPVVVFVNSKIGADLLAEAIQKICNICCLSIHGDKSQKERSKRLELFLGGECPVLVCTSLLGRGMDLPKVRQVINFDMPSSIEEYVHQVGRASRLGSTGWALTFVNNTNKLVFLDLVETLRPLGVNFPDELLNSPYFHQQKQRDKVFSRKRKHKHTVVTQQSLMELISDHSKRRKKVP